MRIKMLYLGCHVSSSKGYEAMGKTALSVSANTFQFFSRNPRGGSVKPFDTEDASRLVSLCKANGFGPFVIHAPYTINPCAADARTLEFARTALHEDLLRADFFDNALYNLHPGSHTGRGAETGIAIIAETLNAVMFESMKTTVLLETMAGKGTEIGGSFEQLRAIIDQTNMSDKIGVCLDTCHVFDGGYDIVGQLESVLEAFDSVIGLSRLKAVHINDSKNALGSHKDRHECIGIGNIGADALIRVISAPELKGLPFILETPNELEGYKKEIAFLRDAINANNI